MSFGLEILDRSGNVVAGSGKDLPHLALYGPYTISGQSGGMTIPGTIGREIVLVFEPTAESKTIFYRGKLPLICPVIDTHNKTTGRFTWKIPVVNTSLVDGLYREYIGKVQNMEWTMRVMVIA